MSVSRLIKNSRIPYEYFHAIYDLKGRNLGPMSKKCAFEIAEKAACHIKLFQTVPIVGKLETKGNITDKRPYLQHAAFDPAARIKKFRIRDAISSEALECKIDQMKSFLSQGQRCNVFCSTNDVAKEIQRQIVSCATITRKNLIVECFPRNSKANWS